MHLIEYFDRGVRLNPDGVAFVRPDGTGAVTYAEAEAITHRVAAALRRVGLPPGAPVAVASPNSPIVFPCVLGVLRAGCTWVTVNARSTPQEIATLLRTVDARALLYAAGAAVDQLRESVPSIEHYVAMDEPAGDDPGLDEWLAPAGTRVPLPPLDEEAIAALIATGGTTGRSKVVRVSHRAFATMVAGFHAHMPERNPVHLVAAPMTHAAGAVVFPVLSAGGTNVVHSTVVPGEILASIERHRVTRLFLPPTAVYALLADPDVRRRDVSSLRYFLYGAAPMSVEKLKEALDVFGPVMAQFYGQTELPMLCTFLSPEEHAEALADPALQRRLASCGRQSVVANVAVFGDDGPCPTGEPGEIVVRSSLRMSGYLHEPEQTAAVRLDGGWQATGDVGYLDDDGYVYLVDRKRDLIISGGFNVFPSEVEQVIWAHPAVKDCAVIGLPDEKWGERVTAVVEVKPGAEVDAADLIALCKQRVGSVKAPKEVLFRQLPRSAVGKVLKRELREEYWAGQARRV
ncbi:AMP-binding protein [Micromonospora yasonensis]|uniref:AMP-binding protein n=1 Tax=Micromonospora yasonensis TaxID=1128667 RepID=UPI0022325169|nr:AMP-binding protein [Micromonospora yasonensis]MCW3840927.1 AMP-binding protein [Micromonospora yasonensis]